MAPIRAYTTIEQSKKLVEILPLESADMYWFRDNVEVPRMYPKDMMKDSVSVTCPCWSLAALLSILNSIDGWYPGIDAQVNDENLWQICMFSYETGSDISTAAINKELVDTCYEVILKLKERRLL